MLEQILDHVHNYFEKEIVEGKFTISNKTIELDFLQNGQYYRICGSVFNDGVHKYPSNDLTNETFEGEIWAMAVPNAVIALSNEIQSWVTEYADKINSPYQSESFGGYRYTKKSASNVNGVNYDPSDWRSVFRSRLNNWRKVS